MTDWVTTPLLVALFVFVLWSDVVVNALHHLWWKLFEVTRPGYRPLGVGSFRSRKWKTQQLERNLCGGRNL